ncbi:MULTISPECIES: 6-phosphogluconate phosphatase [Edwardsiella]|uniref:Putative phosphatase YieH n=1 Tax=Edwardsiella anguillarum ET080813 TaxID=667120 RepID=A0A076LNB3_9GAMM|nr:MULTISPECIES: 6-phosphogluconate phosphatase [Edwardsiella]AIJ08217.1 Putative phosphatase YieH [Edwardsiella anguillarum ET080813]AKR79263.1 6-phosphogluconate phosphatase [Edwardsiella sp. LADL05-105]KAB0591708.1 6-phosphogluconate phosphatase [Edwardsiella anguillarum]MDA6076586.1 6-phosphogluconate phosphatase [Edwardsiella anguillarum]UOU79043.1 6-phosphogluconate phosphatase [Edwardsiella anguillarum]
MSSIRCILFDCDGTLVDSEIICSKAYVSMFSRYGITLSLEDIYREFKGVRLYEIIDVIQQRHPFTADRAEMESHYRAEVARLFDSELQPIPHAHELLSQVCVPMCTASNGPVSKMQSSLGATGMLPFFGDRLYSGYDIQRWKPQPDLLFHAARNMGVDIGECILVDDSPAGAQSGIAAGIPVFYFCADPHNPTIDHPLVTAFDDLRQLPQLWRQRGWQLTRDA